MGKWLKYKFIFRDISSKLNQEDILEIRKISEEFNKLFELYIKQKEIRFNRNINNRDLKIIKKLNIFEISLSLCKNITDEGLKYLGNCIKINLYGCRNITNKGLKTLYESDSRGEPYLSNCTTINLIGCHNITNEGLKLV